MSNAKKIHGIALTEHPCPPDEKPVGAVVGERKGSGQVVVIQTTYCEHTPILRIFDKSGRPVAAVKLTKAGAETLARGLQTASLLATEKFIWRDAHADGDKQ